MGWVLMSEREVHRVEVLSSVVARRMSTSEAASVLCLSDRQVQRLLKSFREDGAVSLRHKARGRPSNNRNEFDFVRSIRVYHIQFSQRQNRDGDCIRSDSTRLGSYGTQGDYHWARSSVAQIPTASDLPRPGGCGSVSYRSVFVDWRDHAGNYGFEEVRY